MSRDVQNLDADRDTGRTLVTKDTGTKAAISSGHLGSGPPAYAESGMVYSDEGDGSQKPRLRYYDGSTGIAIGYADSSADRFIFTGGLNTETGWVGRAATDEMEWRGTGTAVIVAAPEGIRIGDGTSPRFTLDLAGTDGMAVPSGTTQQRPTGAVPSVIRYNETLNRFEVRVKVSGSADAWKTLAHLDEIGGLTGTLALLANLPLGTNKIILATSANALSTLDFVDDDTMATATATSLVSGESVKAFVEGKVGAKTILAANLGDGAAVSRVIGALAVLTSHIGGRQVTGPKIATDALLSEHYAANSVDADALAVSGDGTSGQVLSSAGDGTFSWTTPSTFSLGSGDVGTSNVADAAITEPKLGISNAGSAGQFLQKTASGMQWATPSSGGGGATATTGLSDVQNHAASDREVLVWSGANSRYEPGQVDTGSMKADSVDVTILDVASHGTEGQHLVKGSGNQLKFVAAPSGGGFTEITESFSTETYETKSLPAGAKKIEIALSALEAVNPAGGDIIYMNFGTASSYVWASFLGSSRASGAAANGSSMRTVPTGNTNAGQGYVAFSNVSGYFSGFTYRTHGTLRLERTFSDSSGETWVVDASQLGTRHSTGVPSNQTSSTLVGSFSLNGNLRAFKISAQDNGNTQKNIKSGTMSIRCWT